MEKYKNVWHAIMNGCLARLELTELHEHLMSARFLLEDSEIASWFDDMHFGETGAHISIEQNEEKVFGLLEGLRK